MWHGEKCHAAERYVSPSMIPDCVWIENIPKVNIKHNGLQPIMVAASQMTGGAFGICHSGNLIVAVLPQTSLKEIFPTSKSKPTANMSSSNEKWHSPPLPCTLHAVNWYDSTGHLCSVLFLLANFHLYWSVAAQFIFAKRDNKMQSCGVVVAFCCFLYVISLFVLYTLFVGQPCYHMQKMYIHIFIDISLLNKS